MPTSGVYEFDPALSEIVLDAYDRCGVRASSITADHMISARRSINYVFSTWANKGVNLWAVDLITIPLVAGVATYSMPPGTVSLLDVYLRTYQMGAPSNVAPEFATTAGETTVTVIQPNHGYAADGYINIAVPVSVGGIVVQGFYKVTSVIDSNTYTFTAATAALTDATSGVVPSFQSSAGSPNVTVTFPNHGMLSGQEFTVQVGTYVGGIGLSGQYTIQSVADADTFTITAGYPAGAAATVSENDGNTQIAGQADNTSSPLDRILGAISRTDYASTPNKWLQGTPTTYWFDRGIEPTVTLWQVPNANGPYELRCYRQRQMQTGNPSMLETPDIPYRFQEAFVAALAGHLAIKWRPETAEALLAYADQQWEMAAAEDREIVPLFLSPQLGSYYR